MYDYNPNGSPIADALRQEGVSAESVQKTIEDQLHRASGHILNATLPRDIHHRYATIASEESKAIGDLAAEVLHTLKNAGVGKDVLSGKVAEKVEQGIAELTGHNDYTLAVKSLN